MDLLLFVRLFPQEGCKYCPSECLVGLVNNDKVGWLFGPSGRRGGTNSLDAGDAPQTIALSAR